MSRPHRLRGLAPFFFHPLPCILIGIQLGVVINLISSSVAAAFVLLLRPTFASLLIYCRLYLIFLITLFLPAAQARYRQVDVEPEVSHQSFLH